MIRGTTPIHIFELPFAASEIEKCSVTYKQGRDIKLKKTTEECILEEARIIVNLTQEDTLKFNSCTYVEIQLKVKIKGSDDVMATDPIKKTRDEIFDEEIF